MRPGSVALTTTVPEGPDLGMSYAASEHTRLNLGIGFTVAKPKVGDSRSEFAVRTGVWLMQLPAEEISTFFGGSVEFQASSGQVSRGDLGLLVQAGAEYAASRAFAVGGAIGLGFHMGDVSAYGIEGSRFGTIGAELFLSWWIL